MDQREDADVKTRVREQFAGSGDAYVRSALHATSPDLARMVELAAPSPTERVLDIATGGGHVARAFAPRVAEVVASDLTPEMLAQAERFLRDELGLTNVTFRQADAEALPFDDATFDIVTCRIAPHHFPHPDRFVAEVARVLCPGGRLLLVDSTVPEGEVGTFFNRFEVARDPSHVRSLTVAEWSDLLATHGFDLRAVETYPKRHDFAEWTARARVPEAGVAQLTGMMRSAGPNVLAAFKVEQDGDQLLAFTDVKTLFYVVTTTIPSDRPSHA